MLLADIPLEILNLSDLPSMPEPFGGPGHIRRKRRSEGKALRLPSRLPVIAEDAGLEIPVLDGWPGVHSSRLCPTDKERVALVLDRMKNHTGEAREARFISVAAFCDPIMSVLQTFTGVCQGVLLDSPCGANGFSATIRFRHPGFGRPWRSYRSMKKMS